MCVFVCLHRCGTCCILCVACGMRRAACGVRRAACGVRCVSSKACHLKVSQYHTYLHLPQTYIPSTPPIQLPPTPLMASRSLSADTHLSSLAVVSQVLKDCVKLVLELLLDKYLDHPETKGSVSQLHTGHRAVDGS